jgi:hypothetical protein
VLPTRWKINLRAIDLLKGVAEGGSVDFLHHIGPDAHLVSGVDAEDVGVVGGMIDLAHDDAVVHHGLVRFFTQNAGPEAGFCVLPGVADESVTHRHLQRWIS